MLQIKPKRANGHAQWLVDERYSFGTDANNNYQVHGQGVQGVQACIRVNGDQLRLENIGGSNCVRRNGQSIADHCELQSGDELDIGDSSFVIEDPKKLRQQQAQKTLQAGQHWTLQGRNTAMANKVIALPPGSKTIGRSHECDVCLNVVHLSREHARITVSNNQIRIEDLASSNGTFVNGERIKSKQLKHGDDIAFDTLHFRLVGPAQLLAETKTHGRDDSTTLRPQLQKKTANPARSAAKKRRPPASNPFPPLQEPLLNDQPQLNDNNKGSSKSLRSLMFIAACLASAAALWFVYQTYIA
ncbi:FHA domain-containing protein [Agaribacterium haliotis]|uniref:FHA domain-containing protein n=1 Tax=Agaribacterium haliotis TaxID=2013869 RepID=UPI000BB55243|nr:FHA domain-containing protein [Agaribacterium haliotis]